MEDLYYLTKTDMELEDIAACAEEFGYRHYYVTRAYRDLVIHYSEDDLCRWAKLEKDKLALEDSEREQMSQLQLSSIFMINYHATSLPKLVDFLKRILERHGGVGCDEDWRVNYTIDDIYDLQCP